MLKREVIMASLEAGGITLDMALDLSFGEGYNKGYIDGMKDQGATPEEIAEALTHLASGT